MIACRALYVMLAIFLFGFDQPIHASAREPASFRESLNVQVNVSGATRVGLIHANSLDMSDINTIFVRVPDSRSHNRLCVKLTSRDGRYSAELEYQLQVNDSGVIELGFPSQFKRELSAEELPYVASLATLAGNCDTQESAVYLVSAWHPIDGDASIFVLVNSGRNDVTLRIPSREHTDVHSIPCRTLESPLRIAFDKICEIASPADLQLQSTVIQRDDFFNPQPSLLMPIGY